MRCRRVQALIPAAADGEVGGRRQRALERHLAGCTACGREWAAIQKVRAALAGLPGETPIPAHLWQTTLRRVRLAAAEVEEERAAPTGGWRRGLLPALAFAAVVAIVVQQRVGVSPVPPAVSGERTAASAARAGTEQVARAPKRPEQVARTTPKVLVSPPPGTPPPALAAAPELFMDLPILRHLEKLEHFEAIQTTTLDDGPAVPDAHEGRSNG